MGRHIQNQSQMFFTCAQGCLLYYLLELGTGFDRVLNTLSRHRVVQLNSQINASLSHNPFSSSSILSSCHFCAVKCSKSVSFAKTMVELVEMSCRIVASSLVLPDVKTSFQPFSQLFLGLKYFRNSTVQLSRMRQ